MRRFRKRCMIAAAGMLAAVSLAGCSRAADNDAVVATVGEDEISYGVANFYARMQQAQYETYYVSMLGQDAETMWAQEAGNGKSYQDDMKDSILETLEDMYILKQHAADYESELTEEEKQKIDKAAESFVEGNALEDKEVVSGHKKYIKEFLELVTIRQKMDVSMKEGVDENVSDEEAAQKAMEYVYFSYSKTDDSGNSADMTDDEKSALKETAQTFVDTVKADENRDMSAPAETAGVEVQTATFDAETATLDEELVEAADALENENDVTDLIETKEGIYVAKLTSKLDREATDQKKTKIIEQRKQDQYDSLLEEWKNDIDIDVNERIWKKVDFEKQGVEIKQAEEESTDGSTDSTEN